VYGGVDCGGPAVEGWLVVGPSARGSGTASIQGGDLAEKGLIEILGENFRTQIKKNKGGEKLNG